MIWLDSVDNRPSCNYLRNIYSRVHQRTKRHSLRTCCFFSSRSKTQNIPGQIYDGAYWSERLQQTNDVVRNLSCLCQTAWADASHRPFTKTHPNPPLVTVATLVTLTWKTYIVIIISHNAHWLCSISARLKCLPLAFGSCVALYWPWG